MHIKSSVDPKATLMSDELKVYTKVGREFPRHGVIKHNQGIYVQGDVTTNTVEGFFSLLKRGVFGIFHHVSPHHLHRYVGEFEYRYNERKINDGPRMVKAIKMTGGKRLMYKQPIKKAPQSSE
jgi:hypothetical protein